jgi:hypothetical protein
MWTVNKDSTKRFAMILRICEFLISSVKPAGTNTLQVQQ